ncbi:uncharacterized protein LOC134539628 [Bacillus rossius redtenbacheri]|uniref:uncharacterized protein LOC134539628 n=1 Tax=Bacillus rossius redtenbacheri TaxID=93214 RepID=UPI002FDD9BF4
MKGVQHLQHVVVLSPPPRAAPLSAPPPAPPPRSPRLVHAAQRRSCPHHAAAGDQLQTKLRRLLNADSKENLFSADRQRRYRRLWDDDDDAVGVEGRRGNVPRGQPEHGKGGGGCSVHHKSLPDLHASPATSTPSSPDTSLGSSESWSASERRRRRSASSTPRDAMSTVSSGGRTHKSQPECSRHRAGSAGQSSEVFALRPERSDSGNTSRSHTTTSSQLASSSSERREGRAGQDCRRDAGSPSSYSDSGAEEVHSPTLVRSGEGRRPILRSKSDISHRYSRGPPPVPARPQPRSVAQLELFFEHLGLDNHDYRCLSSQATGSSSPVYFSSVSSVDSVTAWGPWAGCGPGLESGGSLRGGVAPGPNQHRPCEQPSIVERNARIIKWLCNCRKAQAAAAPRKPS